jgi:hypothetical protein
MSMINAAAPYRRDDHQTMPVPVVIPLVEVVVDKEGFLTVTLDREPYSADRSLTGDDLKPLLSDIATDLRAPIRVEVREADDSTFIDIITPRRPAAEPAPPAARRALASAFGISGDGFSAGEQVEVCVVVARQIADGGGTAQLRLPPALLASHPQVVLVGRTSGVVALSEGAP